MQQKPSHTGTIPPVDWDEMLARMLRKYPSTGGPRRAEALDALLADLDEIMHAQEVKSPELANKQKRLLDKLREQVRCERKSADDV
jgi:hypothetical protein